MPPLSSDAGKNLRRLAVALPLAAALGYAVFWFTALQTARKALDAWIAAQAAHGMQVETGAVVSGGSPFRIELRLAAPAAKTSAWSWRGPAVTLSGEPWDLGRMAWRAPGVHDITLTDKTARHARLNAASLEGHVAFARGRATGGEAWLTGGTLSGDLGDLSVRALLLQLPPPQVATAVGTAAADTPPARPLSLDAKGLTFPAAKGAALGDTVDRLTLDLSLEGPVAPGPWPRVALDWRDAGGVLQVRSLGLSYGPLNMTGDGTVAIDRAGQPEGAFTARITGFPEAIEAFRKAGLMDGRSADAAQVVLGLLARGTNGNGRTLEVPLTLQNRVVSLGPVALFKLKPVDWFRD